MPVQIGAEEANTVRHRNRGPTASARRVARGPNATNRIRCPAGTALPGRQQSANELGVVRRIATAEACRPEFKHEGLADGRVEAGGALLHFTDDQ